MEQVGSLAFAAAIVLIVFVTEAYRSQQRASVERALIQSGKPEMVLELRRQHAEQRQAVGWWARPWSLAAFGVASIVSAGLMALAGIGTRFPGVDLTFAIMGIFLLTAGVARYVEERKR